MGKSSRKKSGDGPSLFVPLAFTLCLCFLYRVVVILKEDCGTNNEGGMSQKSSIPETTTSSAIHAVSNNNNNGMISFRGFDDELIPPNAVLDMNIGTNISPFGPQAGRHRILIDPLFFVCDQNAKLTSSVTAFCLAVSDYTGFATFYEYNKALSMSSSLSQVSQGTSHENFPVLSKKTVLVLEGMLLFSAIHSKGSTIHRLKLDMQGHELTLLKNIAGLLQDSNLVTHIMAECFCPNPNSGNQIYQVDNSCDAISQLLRGSGYETRWDCPHVEWGDVHAYKKGVATDFLPESDFESVSNQV